MYGVIYLFTTRPHWTDLFTVLKKSGAAGEEGRKNRRNGEGGGGTPNSIQNVEGIGCIQSWKGVAILDN